MEEDGDLRAGAVTEEELYDAYVGEALVGDARDPDAFLAARGVVGASEVLRERLAAVHRTSGTIDRPMSPFERLGEYRVLRHLDSGGMGTVLLGEEETLGRLVALKLLRPELQASPTLAARFEREAQVVARLRHPNIVSIHGVGEEQGTRFLAMEYIEGEGLDVVIARAGETEERLPVERCVRWAVQVASALQACHEAGIVHRDLKPSNVRIDLSGDAILLDFGIAAEEGASRLTATGRMLGTAAYSAPEQLRTQRAGEVDGRADLFALGVLLYELLTGTHPFHADSDAAVVRRVLDDDPLPLRRLRSEVPHDLETVVHVALEKDPGRRYATAGAMADDLRAVLAARAVSARRAGVARRVVRWMRRHPAKSVAAATVIAAGLVGVVAQEVDRRSRIDVALASAQQRVETFRRECGAARDAEQELAWLDDLVETQFMTAEEETRLREAEVAVTASRRRRESAFHDALSLLRRADRLGAEVERVDAVRGRLFIERWREARSREDDADAGFYRGLAVTLLGEDALPDDLAGTTTLEVRCVTPGATARVFHEILLTDLDPAAEPRFAFTPLVGEPVVAPGTWALRLLADHGSLLAGDLVTAVDGEPIDVSSWRDRLERARGGALVHVVGRTASGDAELPAGARLRVTTRPLGWPADGELIGAGPVSVPRSTATIVVRAPGHEEARIAWNLWNAPDAIVDITLLPVAASPPGFVRIRPTLRDIEPFWIAEREVTAGEYLAFLNDPATQAEVDASARLIRVPRSPSSAAGGGHMRRNEAGRYELPAGWSADWPAIGVSWDDAQAYCRWWNATNGGRLVASLPTFDEWCDAAGHLSGAYVFGNRFHPKWLSSCYALERAAPVPVMSFPRDETPTGLFDMAGSAFEWLDAWWDEPDGERHLIGGSWARAERDMFRHWGGRGSSPERATDETGFRLVLREKDE